MQQRCSFPTPKSKLGVFFKDSAHAARLAPFLLSIPPSPTLSFLWFSPPRHTCPPSCLTLGFLLSPDVDQTPVNNTGQVTPSRLAIYSSFFKKGKKSCPCYSVLSFPILLQLHPVHSLSVRILLWIMEWFKFVNWISWHWWYLRC